MADPQKRLETMLAKLKEKEMRITPQRMAVLKILSESSEHPSVERIYEQVRRDFSTTSLATIYKTIILLKEIGEVLEIGFSDGSSRYDGNKPYPHPHLICTICKTIMDPDSDSLKDVTAQLSRETGFRITSHRLDFFGICSGCQKNR